MSAEAKLKELGIVLPDVPAPVANYVPFRLHANTLYLSGQGPRLPDGKYPDGLVGKDFDVAAAYQHARIVGLGLLAVARRALGSLDKVDYVVKLLGMVNGAPGSATSPRSSTAVPICSSRCSATPAGMPARPSAWAACPTT